MGALVAGLLGGGGALGSVLGGIFAGNAAKKAADIQARTAAAVAANSAHAGEVAGQGAQVAAGDAANRVNTGTEQANALLQSLYQRQTGNLDPYLTTGSHAVTALDAALQPGGDLAKQFTADQILEADPGYQFRMDQGQRALDASAAARGGALGGAATKAALRYGQGYASSEYENAFERFRAQQQDRYNRLAGAAGIGQRANDQSLQTATTLAVPQAANTINAATYGGNAGINAAQYAGNTGLEATRQATEAAMGGANAQASGVVGGANALSNAISGATNAALGAYGMYKFGRK